MKVFWVFMSCLLALSCGDVGQTDRKSFLEMESTVLDDNCTCYLLYNPVCASDGQTYSNSCFMECNGAALLHNGECKEYFASCDLAFASGCGACLLDKVSGKAYCATTSPTGNASLKTSHPYNFDRIGVAIEAPNEESTITLRFDKFDTFRDLDVLVVSDSNGKELDRLSGNLGATLRTYPAAMIVVKFEPTSIFARLFNWKHGFSGQIIFTTEPNVTEPPESCLCTDEYDPVCGGNGENFSNSCEASCAGVAIAYPGECEEEIEPCFCFDLYDPVCGSDGTTFSNSCEASCAGIEIVYDGSCR